MKDGEGRELTDFRRPLPRKAAALGRRERGGLIARTQGEEGWRTEAVWGSRAEADLGR